MNSEVSNTAMRRKNEEDPESDPESDNDGNDLEIDNRDDDGSKRKERRVGKKKRRNLPKDDDMMMMMMAEDGGDEVAARGKRGVCYLSRVPPHMDPSNLRQLLSNFGEILRIYLVPQESTTQVQQQVQRKQSGRFQGKSFTEGWVEFTKKSVAKRVANILNGEQIGGRKRSSFYYDIWNIKYLSKFKWDDLTNEIANKNRTREQKLALEISAAKRERDFYLSKVDQSRALNSMKERKQKKQKTDGVASDGISGDIQDIPKVIRKFPQNRPVDRRADTNKPKLSQDFLAGVFRESS